MTTNKRTKDSRYRGSKTHGCGSMKKRRGAGHRGGRGNAGSGKRGDSKKPSNWKNKYYFGKRGFTKHGVVHGIYPTNIEIIQQKLDRLVDTKLIEKNGDTYLVDLLKIGYNKLLGRGTVRHKFKITTEFASSKAIEKVQQAGGGVILPDQSKEE